MGRSIGESLILTIWLRHPYSRWPGSRPRQVSGWNPEPADLTRYVDQRLAYEIEELYGISPGGQELEAEERRPTDSPDNSSSLPPMLRAYQMGII